MPRSDLYAPQPPMPTDPSVCRWCARRRTELLPGEWYCQRGCDANAVDSYLCFCEDCRRNFRTGRRMATLCYACESVAIDSRMISAEEAAYNEYLNDQSLEQRERDKDRVS